MKRLLAAEPALFGVLVGAALTAGVQFGLPIDQAQANALTALVVAAVTWWVRASVVSPATAVEMTVEAAGQVAENLTEATAGEAGRVTEPAVEVVNDAIDDVLSKVGGLAGSLVRAVP